MTQYIYAVPLGDWTAQHLLETRDGPALCGLQADRGWHLAAIMYRNIPGVSLCKQCSLEREARKADDKAAELREKTEAIRTFWLKERK